MHVKYKILTNKFQNQNVLCYYIIGMQKEVTKTEPRAEI